MKKKFPPLSKLIIFTIAAFGTTALPACGDDSADSGASKAPQAQEAANRDLAIARNLFYCYVTQAARPLTQQVELCFYDLGTLENGSNPETGATECSSSGSGKGTGWNLARDVAEAQLGNYVAGASVKKGVITLTSRGISVNGKDSFSLILVPKLIKPKNEYESPISWELDPASTCLSAGLCDESFMKRW